MDMVIDMDLKNGMVVNKNMNKRIDFDHKKVLKYNAAINCETEKQAMLLLKWASKIGLSWNDNTSYDKCTYWNKYKEYSAYFVYSGILKSINEIDNDCNIFKFNEVVFIRKKISMDKKYKTRDGKKVRILCTDALDETFPVVALVLHKNGAEFVERYTEYGYYLPIEEYHINDLIEIENIPDKTFVKCWNDYCNDYVEEFYDAINDCVFTKDGRRNGKSYDNYEIITPQPEWTKRVKQMLED